MRKEKYAERAEHLPDGLRGERRVVGGEGVRSKWNGEPPYREIDFGFVFVRAVRAGEAKLRGRARESVLWLRRGRTK